jgi:uncharacterized protein with HEPN domain
MSKRNSRLLAEDMLIAGRKIQTYVSGMTYDDFIGDDRTIDAVIRNFEVIGEAASRVDDDFQTSHPSVPWKQLRGYRNRLIHEYFGVDYSIIWDIIQLELGNLLKDIEFILDDT